MKGVYYLIDLHLTLLQHFPLQSELLSVCVDLLDERIVLVVFFGSQLLKVKH